MKTYEKVINQLTTLKLKGIVQNIDEAIDEAEKGQSSYISFIDSLLNAAWGMEYYGTPTRPLSVLNPTMS